MTVHVEHAVKLKVGSAEVTARWGESGGGQRDSHNVVRLEVGDESRTVAVLEVPEIYWDEFVEEIARARPPEANL